jgi:hypothetical protein
MRLPCYHAYHRCVFLCKEGHGGHLTGDMHYFWPEQSVVWVAATASSYNKVDSDMPPTPISSGGYAAVVSYQSACVDFII